MIPINKQDSIHVTTTGHVITRGQMDIECSMEGLLDGGMECIGISIGRREGLIKGMVPLIEMAREFPGWMDGSEPMVS